MPSSSTPRRQAIAHGQVHEAIDRARTAAVALRSLSAVGKDKALRAGADALLQRCGDVLAANALDLAAGADAGLTRAVLERMRLTKQGLAGLADGLRQLSELPDPVDDLLDDAPPGIGQEIRQLIRVPLGVIGVVYEAQPAVTVTVTGLALKAGNAVLLRGAPAAAHTDEALVGVLRETLLDAGVPVDAVQLLASNERSSTQHLLTAVGLVDLVVLRGGKSLVRSGRLMATVPTVELGPGNCHIYIDAAADLTLAEQIVFDSTLDQPAIPHAVQTVLVHIDVASRFVPALATAMSKAEVSIHGDERVMKLAPDVTPVADNDWQPEYLAREMVVALVDSADDAVAHITRFGSAHTQVIVTQDDVTARAFIAQIDAASVKVNVPTNTTDADGRPVGGLFSTQKLQVRGSLEPTALTTTKLITWRGGHGAPV